MSKLKRIAAVLAVLAAVVIAATAAARHYLHPAQLVAALAEQVRKSTGRELVVGGAMALKLFPLPGVVLEDVGLRNAAWGSQPWMVKIGRAEAEMPWRFLLRGKLSITRVSLAQVNVLLETDARGNGNWVMGSADSGPADLSWLTTLQIEDLRLAPLKLAYRDGGSGETTRLELRHLSLEVPAAPRPVAFSTEGAFAGTGFEARGTVGALATLLAGDRPYPLALSATSGGSRMEISGDIGQPLQLAGLNLELRQEGPELSRAAALAGQSVPSLGPYRLSARISGSRDAPGLSAVDFAVGAPDGMEFRARGGIELRRTDSQLLDISVVDLELQARGRELREFLALAGKSIPPAGPYALSARFSGPWDAPSLSGVEIEAGSPERVHLTARGTIAKPRELAGLDLQVTASARKRWRLVEAAASPLLPPFRVTTRLRDRPDGYSLDGLELDVAGSRVNAAVVAARSGERLHITARAESPLIDLTRALADAGAGASAGGGGGAEGPYGLPHLADMDLDLRLGRLVLTDGRALTQVSGRFALTREGLALKDGRLSAGGASVRLDGRMADPARGEGIDIRLGLQGSELAELLGFAGRRIPAVGPYRATALAQGSLHALRLSDIDAQAGKPGQARLQARGRIADALKGEGMDLALAADISKPGFLSRLAGRELPRLPPVKLTAQFTNPPGEYALDDLRLTLGRTVLQGRLAVAPAEPRPRVSASLSGPMLDLSEIRPPRSGGRPPEGKDGDPLKAADLDAELRLDRLVLPDKRALGPLSGRILLKAGALELRPLAVSVGGASAVVEGSVANLSEPSGLDLAVKAEVKDTAALAAFTGMEIPKLPPFQGSGRLSDVTGGYAVSGLKLAFASTTLSGDLSLTRAASRYTLRGTLASPLLDLSEYLPDGKPGPEPALPASDGRVFSDAPLPFAVLRLADAELDLRVETVRWRYLPPLSPVVARLALAGGRLQVNDVRIGNPGGPRVEASATVDAAPGRKPGVTLRAEGQSVELGAMLSRAEKLITVSGGATDFRLDLAGRGNSLRSLMAGLNGSVWIKMGPALIHHASFDLGTGLILRTLDLLNPFRKTDPDTELKCLAINVPVAAGVITSDRTIAAETTKYNAVASGTINLGTEALALGVTPTATQGLSLGTDQIAQVVHVAGTFANPDIGLGMGGVARSAVSLYADVATAGGWLLADALLKKARSDPNPCATALAEKR